MKILSCTFILFSTLILSGCPATMYAHLKNETDSTVNYIYSTGHIDKIPPGETKKVLWHQGCLTFEIEGKTYKYKSEYPNDSYIGVNTFSTYIFGQINLDRTLEIDNKNKTILRTCSPAT